MECQDKLDFLRATLGGGFHDYDAKLRRILVTEEQIERLDLPTKPLKETTLAKAKNMGITHTVEAEAVPVDEMRRCLREELERLLPPERHREARRGDRSKIDLLARLRVLAEDGYLEEMVEYGERARDARD